MQVREATSTDRDPAVATLVRAFWSDPVLRWFFPGDGTFAARARAFFGFLIDVRLEGGLVLVSDDVTAVSSWNPPGGNRRGDDWVQDRWTEAVTDFTPGELSRIERFDRATTPIRPPDPSWYLGVVGVDPSVQGRGLGSAVIRGGLEVADRDGTDTFLETGTEGNLPIYARFGFEVAGRTEPPGGPSLWGLVRHPARIS